MTVVLYGSEYWKQVINLDVLVDKGAISPQDRELFQTADTPEDAFQMLKDGLTKNHLASEGERRTRPESEEDEQALRPEIAKTL